MQEIKVEAQNCGDGIRMSDYLRRNLGLSRTLVTKVKFGGVTLNGEVVTMRAVVQNGDAVEVRFPSEVSEGIEPIDIPLDVLFEDEHILAVAKPTNMPTHPSRGNSLPTLANAVMSYFGGEFVFRSVTRLDRDTSGIVLIAKTQLSASRLSSDMKAGKFRKIYTAVVCGVPKESSGRITAPIRRECEGNIKRIVAPDGKEAITEYRVLSILPSGDSLLEVELFTGRTHQIRVHLSYIGHPLRGDFLYGEKETGGYKLHCSKMEFPHPITGKMTTIISKPAFRSFS